MRNIILVGYMACGKSSIGRLLAKRLGCRLLDTDTYIEQKAGKLIKEIFADEGEAYFRQLETDCIQELIQKYAGENAEQVVFATGGGLPMREENRKLLRQLGQVFLLKASQETIYERVKDDTTRPLLQCEDPLEKIGQMLEQRREAYEDAADITISVDGKTKDEITDEILDRR